MGGKMIEQQHGFSLIGLLVLLPLLISILCGLATLLLYLKAYSLNQHECRDAVLEHQGQLKTHLIELLKLNPYAKQLRAEKRLSKAQLAVAIASGTPAGIAAARAHLKAVTLRQLDLQAKQQKWLLTARALRKKFRIKTQVSFSLRRGGSSIQHKSPLGLAVYPVPPSSLTPDYKPLPHFSYFQATHIMWQLNALFLLPKWLRDQAFPEIATKLRGQCSASITKRGQRWFATPIKAKS